MLICIRMSEWKDNDEAPALYFILHLGSLAKSHRDFTASDQSKHHKERKKPIMISVYLYSVYGLYCLTIYIMTEIIQNRCI